MDWQEVVSLCIVAVTAVLLVGSRLRRRKFSFKRDLPCGCAGAVPPGGGQSIVFHARKGARPEIRVKLGRDESAASLQLPRG